MVGLGAVPAMAQILILFLLPETPRWLMKANQSHLARRILRKVYGDTESNRSVVDHILRGIEIEIQEEEEERNQKPLAVSSSWLPNRVQSACSDNCLLAARSSAALRV
jgi:hypothetical protein